MNTPVNAPKSLPWIAKDLLWLGLLYSMLLVHLSLYPYSGWRDLGVRALDYWAAPWIPPLQRLLWGDTLFNILGYWPLGIVLTLAWSTRLHGWRAILLAVVIGSGMSLGLEALQTFLPSRVPSKLDWLANTVGVTVGAVSAQPLAHRLMVSGRWATWREQWFETRAASPIIVLVLWLFALCAPQALPFVLGPWLGNAAWLVATSFNLDIYDTSWLQFFEQWETLISCLSMSCFLSGVACIGLGQMKVGTPRAMLLAVLMTLTLLVGWCVPQALPLLQHEEFQWPSKFDQALLWALAITGAHSFWLTVLKMPAKRYAMLACLLVTLGWLGTLFLPGFQPLELSPGPTALQQVVFRIMEASQWVAALWPLLAIWVCISNVETWEGD